jgi:hypothetical protein
LSLGTEAAAAAAAAYSASQSGSTRQKKHLARSGKSGRGNSPGQSRSVQLEGRRVVKLGLEGNLGRRTRKLDIGCKFQLRYKASGEERGGGRRMNEGSSDADRMEDERKC